MTTDQAESGASTVDLNAITKRMLAFQADPNYADDWLEWDDVPTLIDEVKRLSADLERVTAELEQVKAQAGEDVDYLLGANKDQLRRADGLIEKNTSLKAERDAARQHQRTAEAEALEWAVKADGLKGERDYYRRRLEATVQAWVSAAHECDQLKAERDALHVAMLKVEELASRPSVADETRMGMIWRIVVDALARFDATRKAAADAEEGK